MLNAFSYFLPFFFEERSGVELPLGFSDLRVGLRSQSVGSALGAHLVEPVLAIASDVPLLWAEI